MVGVASIAEGGQTARVTSPVVALAVLLRDFETFLPRLADVAVQARPLPDLIVEAILQASDHVTNDDAVEFMIRMLFSPLTTRAVGIAPRKRPGNSCTPTSFPRYS